LSLPKPVAAASVSPDRLQKQLAALGYPKFVHILSKDKRNPAVFSAVIQLDLDSGWLNILTSDTGETI
jgi:hypothetical protein